MNVWENKMSDLVIVSNRGPFSFTRSLLEGAERMLETGDRAGSPVFGEGGLVRAMAGVLKSGSWTPTWIGASMGDRDIDVARGYYTGLFDKMEQIGLAPKIFPYIRIEPDSRMHFLYGDYDFFMRFVFFDTRHMHSYYSKFANGFLWPLLHLTRSPAFYKQGRTFPRPCFEKNDFVQYTSSNVTFANVVVDEIRKSGELMKEGDHIVVWNQDYHLMEIAEVFKALLREEGFSKDRTERIHMGHFLHTPFFNIHDIQGLIREDKRMRVKSRHYEPFMESIEDALRRLTWGMLNNDLIGFHTKEYCDNYLEALQEWFPVDIRIRERFYEIRHRDRVTTVGSFPIGLDVDGILAEVGPGASLDYFHDGRDLNGCIEADRADGKVVFGGLERCDYTKGLIERLGVFAHARNGLLSKGKDARLYQISAPSRSDNPDYKYLSDTLTSEVTRMNTRLGKDAVIHLDEGVNPPQNYRFMKNVDVMLVTPLEDGMNLVAFEYILSQKFRSREHRGLLAISTSGASRVLKEKGFEERHGVVYINAMRPKHGGEKIVESLAKGIGISDELIDYVERERRVDDWAEENIQAILECRKNV
jgi:trehalose 6-phosphate synthase/phosphatase